MTKTVIFGGGFDGLLAAHAASLAGSDVLIFMTPGEARLAGQNFDFFKGPDPLLVPIPMIDTPTRVIDVLFKGDPDDYMDKMLGQGGRGKDIQYYPPTDHTMIWNGEDVLKWLKETYLKYATVVKEGFRRADAELLIDSYSPDDVFWAMDRRIMCHNRECSWSAAQLVAIEQPFDDGELSHLTFSGDSDDAWGIESRLFGRGFRLYSGTRFPPVSAEKRFNYLAPQGFNCNCEIDDRVTFVGRLGRWDGTQRRHDSFYRPFSVLEGLTQ